MLDVNSISTQNQNVNFTGIFYKNAFLEKALEQAGDYDLYKFSKILKRMSKTNDNRFFELGREIDGDKNIIQLYKHKNYIYSMYVVGIGMKNKAEECYKNVIKNINNILEKIYPEPEVTKISREISMKRILDTLV